MQKSDLIKVMQKKYYFRERKNIEKTINIFFEALSKSLKNDSNIELRGFGSFFLKRMDPKESRNPQTQEKIYAPEGKKIVFQPSEFLRKIVNK